MESILIRVQVQTNARKESIEEVGPDTYRIKVRARPIEGQANERLIELIAEHWSLPRSRVRLVSGQHSRKKVFELIR